MSIHVKINKTCKSWISSPLLQRQSFKTKAQTKKKKKVADHLVIGIWFKNGSCRCLLGMFLCLEHLSGPVDSVVHYYFTFIMLFSSLQPTQNNAKRIPFSSINIIIVLFLFFLIFIHILIYLLHLFPYDVKIYYIYWFFFSFFVLFCAEWWPEIFAKHDTRQ